MTESFDLEDLKVSQLEEQLVSLEKKFTKILEASKLVRDALGYAAKNLDFFDSDNAREIIYEAQYQYDKVVSDLAPTKKIK